MRFPGRKELPDSYAGARGEQVSVDSSRHGTIDTGCNAYPERVATARRSWVEARSEDFEQLDRRGNLWKDRATGTLYRRLPGAPLLAIGQESTRGAACFFVRGGQIIVLRSADYPQEMHGPVGFVHAQVSAATPGPSGPRIL